MTATHEHIRELMNPCVRWRVAQHACVLLCCRCVDAGTPTAELWYQAAGKVVLPSWQLWQVVPIICELSVSLASCTSLLPCRSQSRVLGAH